MERENDPEWRRFAGQSDSNITTLDIANIGEKFGPIPDHLVVAVREQDRL